jgi:hypothetical protein
MRKEHIHDPDNSKREDGTYDTDLVERQNAHTIAQIRANHQRIESFTKTTDAEGHTVLTLTLSEAEPLDAFNAHGDHFGIHRPTEDEDEEEEEEEDSED